jgi:hypothetical protein
MIAGILVHVGESFFDSSNHGVGHQRDVASIKVRREIDVDGSVDVPLQLACISVFSAAINCDRVNRAR